MAMGFNLPLFRATTISSTIRDPEGATLHLMDFGIVK